MEAIHYAILPLDPGAHLFEVTVWIKSPSPSGQQLSMPTWIPGSYLIREFARHVDSVSAHAIPIALYEQVHAGTGTATGSQTGREKGKRPSSRTATMTPGATRKALNNAAHPIDIRKISKNTWQAEPISDPGRGLLVRYQVYAWDLSVRTAHLDNSHGFFNGSSVFFCVRSQENAPCTVDILPPEGSAFEDWRVATTLPPVQSEATAATRATLKSAPKSETHDARSALSASARPDTMQPPRGRTSRAAHNNTGTHENAETNIGEFGRYRAANYDELIDHPVEMGCFQLAHFETGGCRHEIAITGRVDIDFGRLIGDLKPVCQAQIDMFEPKSRRAPIDRYLFMTMAVGDGYGGLEHRASTALICSRNDLPWPGMEGMPGGYQTFLGLASHEYFHTWHVKRIKPACFDPYDLERETFTALLWVFEGFTSYYDDLMLVRAGVIDENAWLKLMEQNIRRVAAMPGHRLLSVAESSQDAWIKYYRPDENTINAVSSYYVKGALVAMCLDLTIRQKTRSQRSLDDVMRLMWQRYGRNFYAEPHQGQGILEDEMPSLIREATGLNLSRQIRAWAYGTDDLPLAACLKPFGLKLAIDKASQPAAWLGARVAMKEGELTVNSAERGGPASNAGLSAGDKLVAIGGLRATETGLKALLSRKRAGDEVDVVAFRRDELLSTRVRLGQAPGEFVLSSTDDANKARAAWLGQVRSRKRASS